MGLHMIQFMRRAFRRQSQLSGGGKKGHGTRAQGFGLETLEQRCLLSASLVDINVQHVLGTFAGVGDEYGWSVASQGEWLLVGAPRADVWKNPDTANAELLPQAGRAFLVNAVTAQAIELAHPAPVAGSIFGQSVAFVGDRLLVGAIGEGGGAVHVYDSARKHEAVLSSADFSHQLRGSWFGNAMTSYGDNQVLIHTQFAGTNISDVHLFSVSGGTWEHKHRFTNQETGIDNTFGTVMAASGRRVVIGAPVANVGNTGAVFIYEGSGSSWGQPQVITGAVEGDVLGMGLLGSAIVFDDSDLLVGAPGHSVVTDEGALKTFSGAVHRFQVQDGQYARTDSYLNPEPDGNALFGKGLAISGDRLLVGSTPAAYLFDLSRDVAIGKVSHPTTGTQFGVQVAIAGSRLVVGDPSALGGIGRVYISEAIGEQVEPPPPGDGPVQLSDDEKTLVVTGAVGGSHIEIVQTNSVEVIIDGVSFGTWYPTEWIVVHGGSEGENVIEVDGSVTLSTVLIGGAGNDRIKGGGGPNIILGGGGDDSIVGGKSRDLLIGGDGADRIIGAAGDDIIISGRTAYDDDIETLQEIMGVWTDATLSYTDRRALIRTTWFSAPESIEFDGSRNVLTGASGMDWFITSADDKATDVKDQELEDLVEWAGLA
jgi:Ca2+-binding RTX toxin-like protein